MTILSLADRLIGAFPVLPTPFNDDQSVDYDGLADIVERLLASGIKGLTVLGSGSEGAYLTDDERLTVLEQVSKRVAGRATLVAGLVQFSTAVAVDQGKRFKDLGAEALLLGLPQHYDMPVAQVITHYTAVVRDVQLPTLYYHSPKPSRFGLSSKQLGRLFSEVSLVGVNSASIDVAEIGVQIRAIGRPISMFTAHSNYCLACLTDGGVGAMCSLGVLMPKTAMRLVNDYRSGDDDGASAAQARFAHAASVLAAEAFEGDPAGATHWGVKEALVTAGVLKSGMVRKPQPGLSEAQKASIRGVAKDLAEL
jgi:4-hydroxy-tetrahydrodipicolinate synthase